MGEISGIVVTGSVAIWYLGSLVVALRPRDWRAEDEFHNRSIGEYR